MSDHVTGSDDARSIVAMEATVVGNQDLERKMMLERFTDSAQKAVRVGAGEAQKTNTATVEPEHLLWGLFEESAKGSPTATALMNSGLTFESVRELVAKMPKVATEEKPPVAASTKKIIENALREALALGHNYIGTEHLLLAFTNTPDPGMVNQESAGSVWDRIAFSVKVNGVASGSLMREIIFDLLMAGAVKKGAPTDRREHTRKPALSDVAQEWVDNVFVYHPPVNDQPQRYEAIRAQGRMLAEVIINLWANASIATRSE
jgi:hypothetical protein